MANSCAGLDPTWTYLPTPAPHAATASHYYSSSTLAWLTPAAAFENEALTSALRASMSPAHAASSYPTTPSSSSTTSSASEILSGGHDATAPATRPVPAAVARTKTGRVAKRKPRPSRRAQTTYITADPANFRRMVQEITGFPVSSAAAASGHAGTAPSSWLAQPQFVLPTLDTSAFLVDRAVSVPAPEQRSSRGGGASAVVTAAAAPEVDEPSPVLQDLEAMACASDFPTLDSWGFELGNHLIFQ